MPTAHWDAHCNIWLRYGFSATGRFCPRHKMQSPNSILTRLPNSIKTHFLVTMFPVVAMKVKSKFGFVGFGWKCQNWVYIEFLLSLGSVNLSPNWVYIEFKLSFGSNFLRIWVQIEFKLSLNWVWGHKFSEIEFKLSLNWV